MFDFIKESVKSLAPSNKSPSVDSIPSAVAGTLSGPLHARRGTQQLIDAYNKQSRLRAAVHRIATDVASSTWTLFVVRQPSASGARGRVIRPRKIQRSHFKTRSRLIKQTRDSGNLQELESHPLLDMLEFGNPVMSGHSVQQMLETYVDLKGEAFAIITAGPMGLPDALWPIPPQWVQEIPSPGRPFFKILARGRGQTQTVPIESMLWIKDPNPLNPYLRGSGIAESLADELDTDEYAAIFIRSFFYNGAMPDALIALEGAGKPAIEELKQRFRDSHRGPSKAHQIHFTNSKMQVEKLGREFEDLPLVQLREFLRDMTHQAFGIPPEILGIIENSNRATIETAMFVYARGVLVPRLDRLRMEYQRTLVPKFDENLVIDYESPVPEDKQFSLDVMKTAPWAFERAEIREMAGLKSHGDVDESYVMPLNLFERPVSSPEIVDPPTEEEVEEDEENEVEETVADDEFDSGGDDDVILDDGDLPGDEFERSTKATVVKTFEQDDIDNVLAALNPERLTDPMVPLWERNLEKWGTDRLEGLNVDSSFDMLNPLVVEHLRTFAVDHLNTEVQGTTLRALRETLNEGVLEGESVRQLARRINLVFDDASLRRSITIARTEVNKSANFGTTQAQRISGVVSARQWIATPGDRTRETHIELDGQIRRLDAPFTVPTTGETADHPGGFGIADEDINCRCTTVAVENEERTIPPEVTKQIWLEFAREARPWERQAIRTLKSGFRAQQRDVMRAFDDASR